MARIRAVAVSFLTDPERLARLLPPALQLSGEPVVTVELMAITELQWLAGRGYNTLGVRFPVRHRGPQREVTGPFLAVLWENKADPIITGREELGYAKLFCDIPPGRLLDGQEHFEASWEGHRFMTMSVQQLKAVTPAHKAADAHNAPDAHNAHNAPDTPDGTLHHRYLPGLGRPGQAAVDELVITPPSPCVALLSQAVGERSVQFSPSTWQQLPTLAHIVNTLADLPQLAQRGASVTELRSDTSLHNHHILA